MISKRLSVSDHHIHLFEANFNRLFTFTLNFTIFPSSIWFLSLKTFKSKCAARKRFSTYNTINHHDNNFIKNTFLQFFCNFILTFTLIFLSHEVSFHLWQWPSLFTNNRCKFTCNLATHMRKKRVCMCQKKDNAFVSSFNQDCITNN